MTGLAACVGPYGYNGYGGAGYGYSQPASYDGRGYDPNHPCTAASTAQCTGEQRSDIQRAQASGKAKQRDQAFALTRAPAWVAMA